MAAFLTPSLRWTLSSHDRVPRLCRAPALGSLSCPFCGRGAPVAAVGGRFLAPLPMPNGPAGAAFRRTADRGQTAAAPTFTASALTPAMGGDDGVHPVNAGRVSTSSTLNPQEVAACASSASFVQLVGAVGPTRSAGCDVVWASALASHPGTPAVVVDCKDAVRTAVRQLRKVVGKAARNRPIKQASLAPAHDVDEPKKYKDMRSGALALVATSGSGKTYMLEQIATEGASASLFNSDREPEMAKFCRQLQPFVLNFNHHWKLTTVEANLITDQDVVFNFDGLVHLRLIFMHYADLSASYLPYHFQRFVAAVSLALRTKRLCRQDLKNEAVALLKTKIGGGTGDVLPAVLVDEVGKANDITEAGPQELKMHILQNVKAFTVKGEQHSAATLLLSAACSIAQDAGGHVITSQVESSLAVKSETLSGRRITPIPGLCTRDALEFCDLFADGLVDLALSGRYVMMDRARSTTSAVLDALVAGRPAVERRSSQQEVEAAIDDMLAAVVPVAKGLCYCAGGHARTAVALCDELLDADVDEKPVSLLSLVKGASGAMMLNEGVNLWTSASDKQRDSLLASLTLGTSVSWREVWLPERRNRKTGELLQSAVLMDDVRRSGLIVGDGHTFRPCIPPVTLYLLMDHARGSAFYPVLRDELGLGEEKADGQFKMSRDVPWTRWEDFFMRLQVMQSVARSLNKSVFKSTTLSKLLAPGGAIHLGAGPLLRGVNVDASTPRTQVLRRDLRAILSQRGAGVSIERVKTIYQLPYGTPGADAIMFHRRVGGGWIMVVLQFKHSAEDASTTLSPADVVKDWEMLPAVMGRARFNSWKGRMVYVNAANRDHSGFPKQLVSKDRGVNAVCDQQSVVVSRSDMEATLGPTFYNYIMAMDWIHCAEVQPF